MHAMEPRPRTPAPLSAEQVRKVARLARLGLSEEQVERYREQLGAVLAYVQRLQELDLTDVEPLANTVEEPNRLRPDQPSQGISQQTLIEMAPAAADAFVAVPRILGDAGGA